MRSDKANRPVKKRVAREKASCPVKKLRALVLVHSTLVPPESLAGATEKEIDEWRTEYDVITHLKAAGHEVLRWGCRIACRIAPRHHRLEARHRFSICWRIRRHRDLRSTCRRVSRADASALHGCNPRGMLLSRDKVLSKQLLTYHRIPTPQFMVFPRGKKPRISKKLRFPMFVKSSTEDASLGIAHASVSRMRSSWRSASRSFTSKRTRMPWSRNISRAGSCTWASSAMIA